MKKIISLTLIILLTFSLLGCEKGSPNKNEPVPYYILNKNSNVYHRPDCGHLPDEKNQVEIEYADIERNPEYRPCGHCKPE